MNGTVIGKSGGASSPDSESKGEREREGGGGAWAGGFHKQHGNGHVHKDGWVCTRIMEQDAMESALPA